MPLIFYHSRVAGHLSSVILWQKHFSGNLIISQINKDEENTSVSPCPAVFPFVDGKLSPPKLLANFSVPIQICYTYHPTGRCFCLSFFITLKGLWYLPYRQITNIISTLVGNNIVDHSDVVGALPISAAPTTSSFSTKQLASLGKDNCTTRRETFKFGDLVRLILENLRHVCQDWASFKKILLKRAYLPIKTSKSKMASNYGGYKDLSCYTINNF